MTKTKLGRKIEQNKEIKYNFVYIKTQQVVLFSRFHCF